MIANELYELIKTSDNKRLLELLAEEENSVRLMFLQSRTDAETKKILSNCITELEYKDLSKEEKSTPETQSLYTHLAYFFKRADIRQLVDACSTHIIESVYKKRLSAWLHYKRYHTRRSHVTEFANYLDKLSAARLDGFDDYTYEILKDLHDYKKFVITKLPDDIKVELLALFEDDTWIENYPLLEQLLTEGLDPLPEAVISMYTGKEYAPSKFSEQVFNETFIAYVLRNNLFGYSVDEIATNIIKRGQADFDAPYEKLTSGDVVKLYCFLNMRMHYFSSLSFYERSEIVESFYNTSGRIKFVDIGCGPATSGLAFTEYIFDKTGKSVSFDYFGIDRASSMKRQAYIIMNNERFDVKENIIEFHSDILEIDINKLKDASCILINTCYVFASTSLPIDNLILFINKMKIEYPYTPKYIFFQNPISDFLNTRYVEFKKKLKECSIDFIDKPEIKYYNQSRKTIVAKELKVYYEVLKV